MRIFTKSLLTFALLCVAGVVSAQQTVKGWFEVDVVAKANEARDHHRVELQPARTIDGGYVIYARSTDDAVADGDMATSSADKDKTDPANYVDWDTQFFLEFPAANAIPEGGKFRLRMKVKADNAISIGTQSHKGAGNYIHWACIGDVPFTDEWVDYDSGEKTADSNMNGFYCIAFNMGKGTENTYYFKDIILEVYGDKPATPTALSQKWQWTEMINNNDCEGTDNSSYWYRTFPYNKGDQPINAEIVDGAGKDGRGVKVVTTECGDIDNQYDSTNDIGGHAWDNQFWFSFNEEIPAGAHYKVSFDYRAEEDLTVGTQAHNTPGEYNHYQMFGDLNFTSEWKTYTGEGNISSDQSKEDKPMLSVAFNLNTDKNHNEPAHTFYFDNLSFKTGYMINDVRNDEAGGIKILFTEYTNMPDLVKAIVGKKRRVVLPDAIAQAAFTVTVNGQAAPVESVEYDKDGSLYVFLPEDYAVDADAVVSVAFTNPTDEKYQLKYTRGDNIGNAVENFEQASEYDGEIDIIPNSWLSPELESSEPENGSFCLPATINSFALTFDKPVKANLMKAKLDGSEDLVVTADAADQAKVTLMRKPGSAALAEGEHTINITKVYSVNDDAMYEDSPAELTFSVGEAAVDSKLQRALTNAANTLEESDDARYQGDAYATLKAAYEKYDAEAISYTAPSQVQEALDVLNGNIELQKQHFQNCKDYDDNIANLNTILDNNVKYSAVPLYADLKAVHDTYDGKVLTDDAELKTANDALSKVVKLGNYMFTEGASKNTDCGIKVLVERIRQGAETLTNTFGVAEDDELIVAAANAYTDDDDLAQAIKNTIKVKLYEKLAADGGEGLFSEDTDGEGNTTYDGPNLTVFVKNPNFYAWMPSKGVSAENTPGWPLINGNMGCWSDNTDTNSWGDARNIEGLPEDCAFTIYHGDTRTEQTITDLPAGRYIVTLYGSDWGNTKGDPDAETGEYKGEDPKGFVYVKTSDTPAVEEGAEEDRDLNFAAVTPMYFAGQYSMDGAHNIDITVKEDGLLTIGMQFCSDSQYFFSKVDLKLVGPAEGVDYAAELQKFQTGVETVKIANAAVYYDLQGRRVAQPTKGLYIKNNKKVVVK